VIIILPFYWKENPESVLLKTLKGWDLMLRNWKILSVSECLCANFPEAQAFYIIRRDCMDLKTHFYAVHSGTCRDFAKQFAITCYDPSLLCTTRNSKRHTDLAFWKFLIRICISCFNVSAEVFFRFFSNTSNTLLGKPTMMQFTLWKHTLLANETNILYKSQLYCKLQMTLNWWSTLNK